MAKTTMLFLERASFRGALPGRREDLLPRRVIGERLVRKGRPCLFEKAGSHNEFKSLVRRARIAWSIVCAASYPYSSDPLPRSEFTYPSPNTSQSPPESVADDGFSLSRTIKSVWNFFGFSVTAISRSIIRLCPENTSQQTVEMGVKGGLVLLALVFARSIISLLITVGSIAGLLFLGTRIINPKPKRPPPTYDAPNSVRYPQGVYYTPSVYYQGGFVRSGIPVVDPYTSDVLHVYREPPATTTFVSPPIQWPSHQRGFPPRQPPPPPLQS